MDHADLVQGRDGVGELGHDRGRLEAFERPGALEPVLEVLALHEAHDHERALGRVAALVDRDHVGVPHAGEELGLAAEALEERLVLGQHELEREAGLRALGVADLVDDAHAAAAELAQDLVAVDRLGSVHAGTLARRALSRPARPQCFGGVSATRMPIRQSVRSSGWASRV